MLPSWRQTSTAHIAQGATQCITDMRGTAAQRVHLSAVLTRRALRKAIERATNF